MVEEEERKTSGTLPDRGISAPPYPAARRIHSSGLWAWLFLKRLGSARLDQSAQETCGGESTGVPKNLKGGDKLRFSCTGDGGLCLAPCNKKRKKGGQQQHTSGETSVFPIPTAHFELLLRAVRLQMRVMNARFFRLPLLLPLLNR